MNPKGYSARSGYEWLRGDHNNVTWDSWVWNRFNIPRHSFIAWMDQWKRLPTKDRLIKFGMRVDPMCFLCQSDSENSDHLMIQCPYSIDCWKLLLDRFGSAQSFSTHSELSSWLEKPCSGKFRKKVLQACAIALIYQLWV